MGATYRKAVKEDIDILAPIMREADRKEVYASHGVSPREALDISFEKSTECFTILSDDGRVIGMFGVTEDSPKKAIPWLLGSYDIPSIAKDLLMQSEKKVQEWKNKYQELYNFVHFENKAALRWLEWLGFSFEKDIKNNFVRFQWTSKNGVV